MAAPFSIRKALKAMLGLAMASYASADSVPSAADGSNPTYLVVNNFKNNMLNSTNTYRQMFGASQLTWNDTLADYAQNAADGCVFEHTGGPYGENIAEGYASTTDSCQAWGDEYKMYSWQNAGFSEATGHFTQLVWKDSAQVGCGRKFCGASSGWYVVCEYQPQGNVIGSFAQEVGTMVAAGARSSAAATTAKSTPTVPKQTVAAATVPLPVFTGAAERINVGGKVVAAGVAAAALAWA